MKIKLVFLPKYHMNPDTHEPCLPQYFPPLGIATLTGFLKKHSFHVEQDDLDIKTYHFATKKGINLEMFLDTEKINKLIKRGSEESLEEEGEKILRLTKWKSFDVIGFSPNIADNPSAGAVIVTLAKLLKEKFDVPIVMGTAIKWEIVQAILSTGWVDCGIISSESTSIAEWNFLNFIRELEKGTPIEKIRGIIYVRKNQLITNGEEYDKEKKYTITKPDFDGLPLNLYQRELSCQVDSTLYKANVFFLPYFFVRGCPNTCAFCCYAKAPWGAKDPREVAQDLKELSKKYKVKNFFFLNTTVNPTYEYALEVANQLIENDVNILWSDCATFNNMDAKLLTKLKDAGAVRLVYGMETGSPKMLKFINKQFTIQQAEALLRKMWKLRIMNQLDVICGFPYESQEDTKCTEEFLKRNRKYITGVNLNKFYLSGLFQMYPSRYGIERLPEGTPIYGNWSTIAFNEVYGMKWEEKVKQITAIYNRLKKLVDKIFKPTMDAHDVFLFGSNSEILEKLIKAKKGWKEGNKWVLL